MTGAVRTVRRDAVRNQQLVIEAARAALAEHGVDARMDDIAARAGVGVGTVYRHFPNKLSLVDELVRLIVDELVTAADAALARGDGTGLELFLFALGQSFADHHSYADKLMGRTWSDCADRLRAAIGHLVDQAVQHGRVGPDVTLGDVMTTAWALRGVVETAGAGAPDAWKRHLDIHLAGLRAVPFPSTRRPLSRRQLAANAAQRSI